MTTSLSKLINKLDCDNPEIEKLFTREYREKLLMSMTDKDLEAVRKLIQVYVKDILGDYIVNQKIYAYKKDRDHIVGEILIQPENSALVIQYILSIKTERVKLIRLK